MRSLVVAVVVLAGCGRDDGGGSPDGPAAVDAPPAKDPCALCARDELCVQRFDGTCTLQTECVMTALRCGPDTCSTACEQAFCARPYQCTNRPPCGTESPSSFRCYGP